MLVSVNNNSAGRSPTPQNMDYCSTFIVSGIFPEGL